LEGALDRSSVRLINVCEVTGSRARRRRKLLDDLKERRGYSYLNEEALDLSMWRVRFGRGFGPVVRQTTKAAAVPLQTWSGPEVSMKLRFPDFVTTAQDGGKVFSLTHRPHLPQKIPRYSFLLEAESTPGP
jgi:hypothetical protein